LKRPEGTCPVTWTVLRGHLWLLAALVPLLVKAIPLRALVRLLTPPRFLRLYVRVPTEAFVGQVKHRLRRPWNMRRRACLREGLVLFHFLRLSGRPAVLHFGVYAPSTDPRRLHGHCWVTVEGTVVTSPPDQPAAVLMTCGREDAPPP
jgi:hypothetical protein